MERHQQLSVLLATLVGVLLLVSHMPAAITHPQLYADDGTWYGAALNLGPLAPLVQPVGSYLVTFPRLIADLALLFPLSYVPLIFNLAGLAVGAIVIAYLLSSRMKEAIPNMAVRLLVAGLLIAIPNAYDTNINLTNSQWHLALLAFLVLWASRPGNARSWALDATILGVSCMTGPYGLLLWLVAVYRLWLLPKAIWVRVRFGVVSICTAIQALVILLNLGQQRSSGALGASLSALIRIISRQVTIGLLVGAHGLAYLLTTGIGHNLGLEALLAILPVAVGGIAVIKGPPVLRAFWVFAAGELVLALIAPSIAAPRWPSLALPADLRHFHPGGIRYFLYPMLALAISLGWAAAQLRIHPSGVPKMFSAFAGVLVCSMLLVGVPLDWVSPPYINYHWASYVAMYNRDVPGSSVTIPINPRGWSMTIRKQ